MDSFETERIKAERLQPTDFEKLRSFHQNPQVMETLQKLSTKPQNGL